MRCAYLTNGAVLAGFTLTNGHTQIDGDFHTARGGGGALLHDGGLVSNCTITGCSAEYNGGGAECFWSGTVRNCTLIGNSSPTYGGGVYCYFGGLVQNCVLRGNSAWIGGGVHDYAGGVVQNCTVHGNSALDSAGGLVLRFGGTARNTILYGNTASAFAPNWSTNGTGMSFQYCCTTPTNGLPDGAGCIADDPRFADAAAGNYHLVYGSPCIEAGADLSPFFGEDIDGTPRPLDGDFDLTAAFDIGAYEYDPAATDSDGDGMTDGEEVAADTVPTNAASYFRITAVSNLPPVEVHFHSSSNRRYTLLSSTNLITGAWTNVPGQVDIPGSGGPDSLSNSPVSAARHFRLAVRE
jgi:hypothetical protein